MANKSIAVHLSLLGWLLSVGTAHAQESGIEGEAWRSNSLNWMYETCRSGAERVCEELRYRLNQPEHAKERRLYAERFDRECSGGDGAACAELGLAAFGGRGLEEDISTAVRLFRRGCELESPKSCFMLALAYLEGAGVEADENASLRLYQDACNGGYGLACQELTNFHAFGRMNLEPLSETETFRLLSIACADGLYDSCYNLASILYHGRGATPDRIEAARLYLWLCQADHRDSCVNYGYLLEHGEGVQRDIQRALEFYHRACTSGVEAGCESARALEAVPSP